MKSSNLPKYYFSLTKALKAYEKNDTPWTPAVSLIVGLKESLKYIKLKSMEDTWAHYKKLSFAAQEAGKAIGLAVYSKSPSSSVTAFMVPAELKAKDIVKKMRREYGISIAAGQGDIEDKVIRIATMGWINEQDLMMCFSVLEKVLKDMGYKFKMGASVARLQEVLYS
jgi:aspartate aminotransferase-like enzyme